MSFVKGGLHTYLHAYLPTYKHTYVRTYVLIYQQTYIITYLPIYIHTYLLTYMRTYLPTYLPSYKTYLLTSLHNTYLHTDPPTEPQFKFKGFLCWADPNDCGPKTRLYNLPSEQAKNATFLRRPWRDCQTKRTGQKIWSIFFVVFVVKLNERGWVESPVWPDWAIFERFWWHIFSLQLPKYILTFWATLEIILFEWKLLRRLFRLLMVNFGLLFILTSGHPGCM